MLIEIPDDSINSLMAEAIKRSIGKPSHHTDIWFIHRRDGRWAMEEADWLKHAKITKDYADNVVGIEPP